MKYPKLFLSLAIVLFGAMLGVLFQYDLFLDVFFAAEGLEIFISLTLIFGLVALGFLLVKRRVGKVLVYSLVVSCSGVVAINVFGMTGVLIDRWKVDAVDNYVARAVPVLDQIKQKEGAYPSKLPVDLLGQPPELLRDYGEYDATGSKFHFEYVNEPAEWAGGEGAIEFDSTARKWTDDR